MSISAEDKDHTSKLCYPLYEDMRICKSAIMRLKTTRRSLGQHNFVQNAVAPAHLHIYDVLSHITHRNAFI